MRLGLQADQLDVHQDGMTVTVQLMSSLYCEESEESCPVGSSKSLKGASPQSRWARVGRQQLHPFSHPYRTARERKIENPDSTVPAFLSVRTMSKQQSDHQHPIFATRDIPSTVPFRYSVVHDYVLVRPSGRQKHTRYLQLYSVHKAKFPCTSSYRS